MASSTPDFSKGQSPNDFSSKDPGKGRGRGRSRNRGAGRGRGRTPSAQTQPLRSPGETLGGDLRITLWGGQRAVEICDFDDMSVTHVEQFDNFETSLLASENISRSSTSQRAKCAPVNSTKQNLQNQNKKSKEVKEDRNEKPSAGAVAMQELSRKGQKSGEGSREGTPTLKPLQAANRGSTATKEKNANESKSKSCSKRSQNPNHAANTGSTTNKGKNTKDSKGYCEDMTETGGGLRGKNSVAEELKSTIPQQTADPGTLTGPSSQPLPATKDPKSSSNKKPEKKKHISPKDKSRQFCDSFLSRHGQKYIDVDLAKDSISLLKKQSVKFPSAHFFCKLCEFHMETEAELKEHRECDAHQRRKRLVTGNKFLRTLPPPTAAHLQALSKYLNGLHDDIILPETEYKERIEVVQKLEAALRSYLPGLSEVELRVCGSVKARCALKDSDTNVIIVIPSKYNIAKTMMNIHNFLEEQSQLEGAPYKSVVKDFSCKQPHVTFSCQAGPEGKFVMRFGENSHHITNLLIAEYSNWHPTVRKLICLFKHLAKMTNMVNYEKGSLAAFCFPILAIHYLQMRDLCPVYVKDGVLDDVLPADFEDFINKSETLEPEEDIEVICIADLFIGLLKYFSIEFNKEAEYVSILSVEKCQKSEKTWSSRRLAIEDPGCSKRNLTRVISHPKVYDFIDDQIRLIYKYFAVPQLVTGPAFTTTLEEVKNESDSSRSQFEKHKVSVTIDSTEEVKVRICEQKVTSSKMNTAEVTSHIHITDLTDEEELGREDKSHSDSDSAGEVNHYENNCDNGDNGENGENGDATSMDLTHYKEFIKESSEELETAAEKSKGSDAEGDLTEAVDEEMSEQDVNLGYTDDSSSNEQELEAECDQEETITDVVESLMENILQLCTENKSENAARTAADKPKSASNEDSQQVNQPQVLDAHKSDEIKNATKPALSSDIDGLYDKKMVEKLTEDDMCFSLSAKKFPAAKGKLPIICPQCSKNGHIFSECPDDDLPGCLPLPPMPKAQADELTQLIKDIQEQNGITYGNQLFREALLKELLSCISSVYPDAELTLYGSSCNGFGKCDSDMDICMTFRGKASVDPQEMVPVIKKISKCLYRISHLKYIQPITTAKVPIVKFYSTQYELEGDISLYNILAQRNTQMLLRYSTVDPRVKALGYMVKEFAKMCKIGDASRGSLSSYAYIIMMIYYLQQCEPPVLPVLQEMYDGEEMPEFKVEDWNTWYFDGNDKQLEKKWATCRTSCNKQTLSELWIGFLDFYAQKFDFKTLVVSIRQKAPMTKFEKLWNSSILAIEDPFELNRNLGGGLSKKMHSYIMSTIIRGRKRFGERLDLDYTKSKYGSLFRYWFSSTDLTGGAPLPNDRGCHICQKIGHKAQDCPKKQELKENRRWKAELKKKKMEQKAGGATAAQHKKNKQPGPSKEREHTKHPAQQPVQPLFGQQLIAASNYQPVQLGNKAIPASVNQNVVYPPVMLYPYPYQVQVAQMPQQPLLPNPLQQVPVHSTSAGQQSILPSSSAAIHMPAAQAGFYNRAPVYNFPNTTSLSSSMAGQMQLATSMQNMATVNSRPNFGQPSVQTPVSSGNYRSLIFSNSNLSTSTAAHQPNHHQASQQK